MADDDTSNQGGIAGDLNSPGGQLAEKGASMALNMVMPGMGTLMDAGMSILGFGLKAAGTASDVSQSRAYAATENALASQKNAIQTQEIQTQQAIQDQHRQAMQNDNDRKQLENIRNAQRSQSIGMAAAVNQGSQFGSGLLGQMAGISGQQGWQFTGLAQARGIGENVFNLNQQYSAEKIAMAGTQLQSDIAKNNYAASQATSKGLASAGQSLMSAAPAFGRLMSGPGKTTGGGSDGTASS